jgi:hypothetical protein
VHVFLELLRGFGFIVVTLFFELFPDLATKERERKLSTFEL